MSSSNSVEEEETGIIFQLEEQSSGEDPPMSEWSSFMTDEEENWKMVLQSKGLYSPGSGELCAKYISQSDSKISLHLYYHYPAVHDPGIKEAFAGNEKPVIYDDDGQSLYLALCLEMNSCPVRIFHRNLLSDNINLSYYGVNPQGVRAMASALQYNKFVRSFDLTDNHLTDDACYHLGQMLKSNVTLREINLSGCRIGFSGLLRLGEYMHNNQSLRLLNLANNNIGDEGGMHFAKMIFKGISVKRVSLSKNGLGRLSALAIAEAFEYKDKITHLDLSWNKFFHVPSITRLLEQMSQSEVLKEVNLSWNFLGSERVAEAIKHMLQIPTLTDVDLSNNRFTGEPIEIITSNLIKAKKLVTLDLSFNPMTPTDAFVALEKLVRPRVKLQNLLMTNVWVNKPFMILLERVKRMKCRKKCIVTFAGVLENWIIRGADARELILKRADYLCTLTKNKKDVALFFLALAKETPKMPVKNLLERREADQIPIDEGLINELATIFPGASKSSKMKSINLECLCEFMRRIWPTRQLPPTPPPEPEVEPNPSPEPESPDHKEIKFNI